MNFSINLMVLFYLLVFSIIGGNISHASDLRIYGFGSIVASQTSTVNQVGSIQNNKRQLTMDPESRLGLNLSADLSNEFKFAGQILARGNDEGEYSLKADWIFVTYKMNDHFSFRVGRQINPAFLFSEQIDVGYTYLWVRLPNEVYGSYPVKSFNGLSAIYTRLISDSTFQVQLMGGAGDVNIPVKNGKFYGSNNNTRGIDLSVSAEKAKFHVMYLATNADGKQTMYVNQNPPVYPITNIDFGTFHTFTAGGSFEWNRFLVFAEGARIIVDDGTVVRSNTSAYGSLGYQVTSKFTPYLTYAWLGSLNGAIYLDEFSNYTSPKKNQHSMMVGVNYKIVPTLTLKGEYMRTQQNYQNSVYDIGINTYSASVDFIF